MNVGAFQWMEGVRVIASGPMAVATGLGLGSHTLTLLATGPAGGTAVSTVGLLVTSSPVTDPVSVSGQIRSTSGVPLNGVAVSVSEKATGRAVACVTPALAGQGAYWVQFVSAPRSVGPTQTTTYEFSLEMGGVLRSSIPASITVSSGTTRFGQIVQELLVP